MLLNVLSCGTQSSWVIGEIPKTYIALIAEQSPATVCLMTMICK